MTKPLTLDQVRDAVTKMMAPDILITWDAFSKCYVIYPQTLAGETWGRLYNGGLKITKGKLLPKSLFEETINNMGFCGLVYEVQEAHETLSEDVIMSDSATILKARITDMPKGMFDPMPKVMVHYSDNPDNEVELFEFYPDEISFQSSEFIGLTREAAVHLKFKKDRNYLRS